jgi:anti-anti-sigma factor
VGVTGDLDMATSAQLHSALEETDPAGHVVIDLTACDFLDSSAIRVLLEGAMRAESAGGSISLVTPDPQIRRVLEIAGLEAKLPIHPTLEAAR